MAFELLKVKTIERPNAVGYEDEEDESEILDSEILLKPVSQSAVASMFLKISLSYKYVGLLV